MRLSVDIFFSWKRRRVALHCIKKKISVLLHICCVYMFLAWYYLFRIQTFQCKCSQCFGLENARSVVPSYSKWLSMCRLEQFQWTVIYHLCVPLFFRLSMNCYLFSYIQWTIICHLIYSVNYYLSSLCDVIFTDLWWTIICVHIFSELLSIFILAVNYLWVYSIVFRIVICVL